MVLPTSEAACSLRERRLASMSNWHSTEADQALKELNANPCRALSVKAGQRVSPFRLLRCF